MIIDAFIFFNEFEILEGRLEYLYPHVDYFVIVESNLTHSGKDKPLFFMENLKRYKKYRDKILYIPYITKKENFDFTKMPLHDRDFNTGPWALENAHRRHMGKCLDLFDDNDIILFSDLDEIPHKGCLDIAKKSLSDQLPVMCIEQTYLCYNFNQRQVNAWKGSTISTVKFARNKDPQTQRNERWGYQFIANGGWHLTYWGDAEKIKQKLESFAHTELDRPEFKDPTHIKEKIKQGTDLFNRNNEFVKVDLTTIPEDILKIFGKYHSDLVTNNTQ